MKVTHVDHMGTDLSVVNAARVSFAKTSEMEVYASETVVDEDSRCIYEYPLERLSERDTKLIRFLARNNHWTPFGHTSVTLHFKAPIFVARQLGKHQVGLVWNEVSRRYVSDEPEFFEPRSWRKAADNVKQGSSDEEVESGPWAMSMAIACANSEKAYRQALEAGVCPEQARMILPQSMYTEWFWTGSIAAFSRVYKLRADSHTQRETQEIAGQIDGLIAPLFPVSWEALTK